MEIGVTVDYSDSASDNSLTQQSSEHTNQTIKNLDEHQTRDLSSSSTSNSSTSFESITTHDADAKKDSEPSKQLNDNQLYEQLSQMKPLKPLNFKSSTSICLNQPDSDTQSMTTSNESTNLKASVSPLAEQSDSKMSSSSTSSLSSNSSSTNLSGNAHSENAESPANNCDELPLIQAVNDKSNIKNDVSSSSSTCSFSSGYNSDNNSNIRVQSQKSEILIEAKDMFANTEAATQKQEQQHQPINSSTTMVVIPRRNSTVLTSINSSLQQGSTASRRVSLSVTDL